MRLQLDKKRTLSLAVLALFAFTSLGFAVFGLLFGPGHKSGLDKRYTLEVPIFSPRVPELDSFLAFWEESGFFLVKREARSEIRPLPGSGQTAAWIQGLEHWVLVPTEPELDLGAALFRLCSEFLHQGWPLQLEAREHGYTLGFLSSVQGGQEVLALKWQLDQLNPRNYGEHVGGIIPVLGEPFDPAAFRKGTPEAPLLAVVIDDWGHNSSAAGPLISFPLPLTVAVLPKLIMTAELAERAHAAGHEVILHQPMEALDTSLALGPGGIYRSMEAEEVAAVLRENLSGLPMAVGVSNHMGSLVTEDAQAMESVLETVRDLGMYFLDSRTTNRSVVAQVARAVGVPYGENDLFLDNENEVDKIKAQLRIGLQLAKRQGQAVVIGHVRPATAVALWEMIPELLSSGVELVPISRVLTTPGEGVH